MQAEKILKRQCHTTLAMGLGAFIIFSVDEAFFSTGMAVNMLATQILSITIGYRLTEEKIAENFKGLVIIEITTALCVATVTSVALSALTGIPIFSPATLNLIAVTAFPTIVGAFLTAYNMSNLEGNSCR